MGLKRRLILIGLVTVVVAAAVIALIAVPGPPRRLIARPLPPEASRNPPDMRVDPPTFFPRSGRVEHQTRGAETRRLDLTIPSTTEL